MLLKIILLLNIITWSVIAGLAYMYIIALSDVSRNLDAPGYIRFRQLIDRNFMAKYKWVIYTAMLITPLLSIVAANNGIVFIVCSLTTTCMLIIDLYLTLKGNLPINKLINTWEIDHYPDDWELYRAKWLSIYSRRQVVTIIGFISLVIAAVFGD